jgi:hypothetical protein
MATQDTAADKVKRTANEDKVVSGVGFGRVVQIRHREQTKTDKLISRKR